MISPNIDLKNEATYFEQACQTLPRMTAFFMEELAARLSGIAVKDRRAYKLGLNRFAFRQDVYECPSADPQVVSQEILPVPFPSKHPNPLEYEDYGEKVVQTLIRGLSDHFSDLMMGIWCNASLIRYSLSKDHPAFERVVQMESVIKEGAYLIQLILGYLGERGSSGKTLCLNQLVHYLASYLPEDQNPKQLVEYLQLGTKASQPILIASATARIIEFLTKGIDTFRRNLVLLTLNTPDIQKRIGIITALVQKSEMITTQLLCYAGDIQLRKKSTNIKTMINRQYRLACERYPKIHLTKCVTPRIPRMVIDSKNTEWVIAQLIENAAHVLPSGGCLGLALKPLYAEAPKDRCGVRGGMDYIVITVDDNGPGIASNQRLGIFNPFYTTSKSKDDLGLGLAAANGIIRMHKGYIQLRSKPEQGSCFKIYLPVIE